MTKLDRTGKACTTKKNITEEDCEVCPILVECIEDKARNILGYPCEEKPEEFGWGVLLIEIEETGELKGTAQPTNIICNSCKSFKKCAMDKLEQAKYDKLFEEGNIIKH